MKYRCLVAALVSSACSSPLAPAYAPPAHPAGKLPLPVTACAVNLTVLEASARLGYLKVRNDDACERLVGAVLFVAAARGPLTQDNQRVFHVAAPVMVKPGQTVELHSNLPGPCTAWQWDPIHTVAFAGTTPTFNGEGQSQLFDVSAFGGYFADSMELCPREADPPAAPPAPPAPPPVFGPPNNVPPPPPQEVPGKPPVVVPGLPPVEVPGLPPAPVPGLPPVVVPPAPGVPTPREVPPVCPVVTIDNWRTYVTHTSVYIENLEPAGTPAARASFTITVPYGCTVPLSLVSYEIRDCAAKFPQRFVAGSPATGAPRAYGPGTYSHQLTVERTAARYQVDLRLDGFEPGHWLTQANESAYYEQRTIDWLVDRACLPEGM